MFLLMYGRVRNDLFFSVRCGTSVRRNVVPLSYHIHRNSQVDVLVDISVNII